MCALHKLNCYIWEELWNVYMASRALHILLIVIDFICGYGLSIEFDMK